MQMSAERSRKPPYASNAAIDGVFEKMRSMSRPSSIDSKWAAAYNLDPQLPASIPTMFRWLKIVDEAGKVDEVWNQLRLPSSRASALAPLVRNAYREVFSSIDVEEASRQTLAETFIQQYGVGDVQRPVACFLTLCRLSGIEAAASRFAGTTRSATATRPTGRSKTGPPARLPRAPKAATPLPSISLSLEIPSSMSEEAIAERIRSVMRATRSAVDN